MTPVFYFSLLSLIFLVTLKLLFQTRRYENLPPGPPCLPIIGNLHQLKSQLKEPLHRSFHSLSQKYGQIFSLRLGSQLLVVVSSPSAAQECFTKNDIILANRPHFPQGKHIGYNNTVVTQAPYGDHWRNLRRIMTLEVLSSHRLNSFLEIRRDEIMRLIQKLATYSRDEFTKVELRPMFQEMTFNTIMRMVSGKRYYGDERDVEEARQFRKIVKELQMLGGPSNAGNFLAILRLFDIRGSENKVKRLGKRLDAFLQGLIDEHRSGKQCNDTMIDHLLVQQQSHPEYYTDEIIKGLILIMFVAGTDTQSVTLEWAMSNLLNHPEILQKARNEVDTEVGLDRFVDEPDIAKLPYIQYIVHETLRLYPATPLLLPHFSSEDCTIQEYNVPHGTILWVNSWAIHRDPNLWTEPTYFKPERFEKEGEVNKLLSFGLGRRACPGANLAQRTVGLTLGILIQNFEWKRIEGHEIDMAEAQGTIMSKKTALEAMCKVLPRRSKDIFTSF